ncbi:hypothetical protein O7627_05200 [Solwaraspora sp. WMMD1047]|uniref:hypothetical protein n=1 Tax=Solwaraspora sp. WMMD1047 TaxID=3016102 RepID=UPI0024175761|nr:hypothetical protein [Solwaraspora sp. WMMD1047]MDG4828703.1 hypothetical protein [Solwaraspora sp. WMMD1047]
MSGGGEQWDGRDGSTDPQPPGDDYAITLLRRLDDEPGGPSRVDLGRAMAEGKRRRRVRRVAGAGGAAALTVAMLAAVPVVMQTAGEPAPTTALEAASAPAPTGSPGATPDAAATPEAGPADADPVRAPKRCRAQPLPIPDDVPMSLVTGMDPTGQIVLGRSYPDRAEGSYPVLLWASGRPRVVDLPGSDQSLVDATSKGVAVGSSWGDDGPRPFVVLDGEAAQLPGVRNGEAVAINESGQIVGTRDGTQPVLWPSGSEQPVDLPLPESHPRGAAVDIDEDGTVIGTVIDRDGSGQERAHLWAPDGTSQLLPLPTFKGQRAYSFRPQSIRNGWVTGLAGLEADQTEGLTIPVRLHLASGRFVDFPDLTLWPQAGNAQGWVVGSADGLAGLLTDDGLLPLPVFAKPQSPTSNLAVVVSDDGRTIGGQGDDADGNPQALLWRCE